MAKILKQLEMDNEVVVLGRMVYCVTIHAFDKLVEMGGEVDTSVPYCIRL